MVVDMSVVKEKSFAMPPIEIEEAVMCLDYIDHDCKYSSSVVKSTLSPAFSSANLWLADETKRTTGAHGMSKSCDTRHPKANDVEKRLRRLCWSNFRPVGIWLICAKRLVVAQKQILSEELKPQPAGFAPDQRMAGAKS